MKSNTWEEADLIKNGIGKEDKVGVFFNLEWVDKDSYKREQYNFLKLLYQIHQRGAVPLISLHTGLKPKGKNPLHPINRIWLGNHARNLFHFFDTHYPYPIEIRLFYEMNFRSEVAFVYGLDNDLNGRDHEEAYKEAVRIFAGHKWRSKFNRKLAFSPSALHDFSGYYLPPQNGYYYFDSVGVDGYDIFPGLLRDWINTDVSFESWLQLLAYYFVLGKRSPEQVFENSLVNLKRLTNENIPLYIYEFGSKEGDVEWLDHTVWLAASYGADGAFPFIYDKEYQVKKWNKPYEANWRKTLPEAVSKYSESIRILNNRM